MSTSSANRSPSEPLLAKVLTHVAFLASEELTVSQTLRQFFASLAADPQKMEEYLRDPESAVRASGLAERDKMVLTNVSTSALNNALAAAQGGSVPGQHVYTVTHGRLLITIYITDIGESAAPFGAGALVPPPVHPPSLHINPPAIIRPAPTIRPAPIIRPAPTIRPAPNGHHPPKSKLKSAQTRKRRRRKS